MALYGLLRQNAFYDIAARACKCTFPFAK